MTKLTPRGSPPTIGRVQTQATPTETSGVARASVCLFLALACFYTLVARGRITSIDEWHIYGTTESLVERGAWELRLPGEEPTSSASGEAAPKRERRFSRYSVVPSILGVPFCRLALPLADRFGAPDEAAPDGQSDPDSVPMPRRMTRRDIMQEATTLQTPWVTAATAAVLFFGLCRLSVSRPAALATVVLFGLGTLALPYSGSLYVQPVAALGLAGVVLSTAVGADVWVAVALAFLMAVRLEFAVLLGVLGLHAVRFRRPPGKAMTWLFAGAAVGIGLHALVNFFRGDSLIMGDYGGEAFSTPFWIGLHGLLFSSGKGLVWYAPAAAAGLVLMPWLMRAEPRVGFLAAGTTVTILLMIACWWTWHGGWSWGPRLVVPLMPVLVLPLAWVFDRWHEIRVGFQWLLISIVSLSLAVQLWAATTDPVGDRAAIWPLIGGNENESIYVPQIGPWSVRSESGPDLLWWRLWRTEPNTRPVWFTIVTGLVAASGGFTWLTCRCVGLRPGCLRALVPTMRPVEVFAFAMCLVVLAAPSMLESWLVRGENNQDAVPGGRMPRHFHRLYRDRSDMRLTGRLYIPIRGDYTFYQQGPPGTQMYLDGRAIFRGAPAQIGSMVSELDVGFHGLEVESRSAGHFNALYWTTPGNAHYKEPIPRVYLSSPNVTWLERWAIVVVHWKWVAWVLAILGVLFVSARQIR